MLPRQTFVVHIREPDRGVVVEDVHRRDRVRLASLAELPDMIAGRLEAGREADVAIATDGDEEEA